MSVLYSPLPSPACHVLRYNKRSPYRHNSCFSYTGMLVRMLSPAAVSTRLSNYCQHNMPNTSSINSAFSVDRRSSRSSPTFDLVFRPCMAHAMNRDSPGSVVSHSSDLPSHTTLSRPDIDVLLVLEAVILNLASTLDGDLYRYCFS